MKITKKYKKKQIPMLGLIFLKDNNLLCVRNQHKIGASNVHFRRIQRRQLAVVGEI